MNSLKAAIIGVTTLLLMPALACAQQAFKPPENIAYRQADIMSEGVRLSAELFSLKELTGKPLPTVILCHGWGGTAALLRRQAVDFAQAGYLAITFDYRGWGASDSRVILTKPAPTHKDGNRFTAEVKEVREVVDPFEQTTDIFNVIHWAVGEPQVDKDRLGLWGTSYAGGHVVYVAARDPRVKCLVSQVGALDSRFVAADADQLRQTYTEATQRAHGEIGYPAPRARVVGNLQGAPIRDKLLHYAPVDDVAAIKNCAMLFIVAEKEELFRNEDHAKLAYERAREPKKYVVIPGITHYGIYLQARPQATKLAIEWFDQHLKQAKSAKPAEKAPADASTKAPTANRPDEPVAGELSLAKAAEFLDAASVSWTAQKNCGTCHTNYPYLMARPALGQFPGAAAMKVRGFFEDRAANWNTRKPLWDTEVVATASALAFNDAKTTGQLHPLTRSALDRMWTLQRAEGSWNWLNCNWPPAEADDYYGVTVAALGAGIAPDGYAKAPAAQAGLAKIRAYLSANPAPSLHHQTMLLWAACHVTELMPAEQQKETMRRLLALQRPDGGWSLPSLGTWKRHSGEPNDRENAPSDGYATGLVVYVLHEAGLPKEHAGIRQGVAWLRAHQRESGRWFTRSLSNDRHHYITNAGTAYAVMALAECDVK
jgi:squalene-hopene/tetraprenyl-beta-curcumene cyclase